MTRSDQAFQVDQPRMRQKICFFGNFGAGNFGNDCTLQAILSNLANHLPELEVTCICTCPEETSSKFHICAAIPIRDKPQSHLQSRALRFVRRLFIGIPLELRRCFKAMSLLRASEMLVMTGTGMLGDFGISPFDLHYDILRWSLLAKLCRCRLFFVSVGVGPIRHPLSRCFVKAALALADYRSYRDDFSRQYLESIGFRTTTDSVYPDLAFSLPGLLTPQPCAEVGCSSVVGLGIMTYFNKRASSGGDETTYREYLSKIGSFVTWLLEHNYTVRLLIGDAVWDDRVRRDLKALLEGAGWKYQNERIIDEPISSFDDVVSQIATTECVVASRFHNILLALMLNKPVLAISYHEKVDSLMKWLGLTHFCQDIEQFDVPTLTRQLTEVQEHSQILKKQIADRITTFRKDLDDQYDHIFASQ
jgi:polysaccharide pyruvyl transferase WcaK-like protein